MRAPSLHNVFLPLFTVLAMGAFASALGTSCTAPVTSGTAAPTAPFWMEQIQHQGSAPFNPNPSGYQVFRNVKVSFFSSSESPDSRRLTPCFRISEPRATVSLMILRRSSETPLTHPTHLLLTRYIVLLFPPATVAGADAANHRRGIILFLRTLLTFVA